MKLQLQVNLSNMTKHGTSAWLQLTILMKKWKIWYIWYAQAAQWTPIVPVSAVVSNRADPQLTTLIKHLRNWWPTPSADGLMPEYWLILAHIGFCLPFGECELGVLSVENGVPTKTAHPFRTRIMGLRQWIVNVQLLIHNEIGQLRSTPH